MGNIISSIVGNVYIYYSKIKDKFYGAEDNREGLLTSEDRLENEKVNNDVLVIKKENHKKNKNNEYQLIKNSDDFEIKSDNTEAIEEISKEIKNIKIDFDTDYNKFEAKEENTQNIDNLDNLDDLKMQILNDET
jgi:hypothetical protein